jgi:hypothetical protein
MGPILPLNNPPRKENRGQAPDKSPKTLEIRELLPYNKLNFDGH